MAKTYNLSQLESLADGDNEFILEIVSTFLEHAPIQVQDIKNAFDISDYNTLGQMAHKIKPSIDLMGIESLTSDIRLIEKYGKNEENLNKLPDLINKLIMVSEEVFEEMRTNNNM
jgi:HPt (histidine-containing phosphotransfer) domain-containing protein